MTREEALNTLMKMRAWRKWGKEQKEEERPEMPEQKEVDEAFDVCIKLLQSSIPSNLDEAANNYGIDIRLGYPRVMDETDRYIYNAFKAGAEWMAGQGVSEEFDVEDGMLPCFDSRLLGLNTIACAPTVLQCKDDDVVIMQLRKK